MRSQFQTEETQETIIPLPATTQAENTTTKAQDTQHTQAVQQWLTKIQTTASRDKKRFWGFFMFCQLFFFLPLILSNSFPVMRGYAVNPFLIALLFLPAAGMMTIALRSFFTKPRWDADELTRIGGVQAVGTLIELLNTPKAPQRVLPLYTALTQLLPQMKASDAPMLSAAHRRMLYLTIQSSFSFLMSPAIYQDFRLAVLKALEQIGDADAVPIVQHLANGQSRTAPQIVLKTAANECLLLLRAHLGSVEANTTLLRASSLAQTNAALLLRPTEFAPDANPVTLLRASEPKPK